MNEKEYLEKITSMLQTSLEKIKKSIKELNSVNFCKSDIRMYLASAEVDIERCESLLKNINRVP